VISRTDALKDSSRFLTLDIEFRDFSFENFGNCFPSLADRRIRKDECQQWDTKWMCR
jgi:hypothetical protein